MKILIGADLVPTQSNEAAFISGNVKEIVDEKILTLLHSCDYRIFNLETPLTDILSPLKKQPNLIARTLTVNGIKALEADLISIANNHIKDQNVQGLESTINVLEANEISHVGAGKDLSESQKPYIIEKDGLKIGIYSCAEHEFSIAEENYPGANPFDPLESFDHIENLKKQCDYVIVLYHGGKEYYRYPSPDLQKICRKMCDKGANLVVCQHSHCIGCEEKYSDSTIVYGQGNFIFDQKGEEEKTNTAILVCVEIENDLIDISYFPIYRDGNIVRGADNEKAEEILHSFQERTEEIKEPGFVKKRYSEFAKENLNDFLAGYRGLSFLERVIRKLICATYIRKIPEIKMLYMLNHIECEAHRELFIAGMKEKLEDKGASN